MIPRRRRLRFVLALAALALTAAIPAAADEPYDERASYSYVRTLDGRATLASSTRAPGEPVGVNEPLLQGDQIAVERGARLEIVLADRNVLRVGGGATLRLVRVAFSADRDDRTTRLDLEAGEILLDVTEQALGDELPEIRTPEGTIYVHQPGRYRVVVGAPGDLQLAVRDGYAELLTERGSTVVRSGEEAWTSGDRWGTVELATAGPRGELERWADELERGSRYASQRELRVEPHLAYSAANLADYGSWVYVDASWYWRPRVAVGWRPYWDGRWAWTPSGLTWVSYEPWGWVPYHYGSWCVVPGYGWVWKPGRLYSPAWVYWYVGPSWTGWCPVGYYTHHYRSFWPTGFHFGVYGWTRGHWGFYSDWCFLPSQRLFARHPHDWRRTGSHLGRTERGEVPPGILTTDTGDLPRERWERPADVVRTLERRGGPRFDERTGGGLPEVTDFVARRPSLPPSVERAVRRDPSPRGDGRRGSPLDPGTTPRVVADERPNGAGWRRRDVADGPRRLDEIEARRGAAPEVGSGARPRGGFGGEVGRAGDGGRPFGDREAPSERGAERRTALPDRPAPRAGAGPIDRGAPSADDRQGWRQQESGAGVSTWRDAPAAAPRSGDEPVARVIGGVRRGQPAGDLPELRGGNFTERRAPTAGVPSGGPYSGSAPRATAPPAGWRGAPGTAPRGSAPTTAPRDAGSSPAPRAAPGRPAPRATPSSPAHRATPSSPPPRAAPSSPPPSRGPQASAPSSASRGGSGRPSAGPSARGSSSDRGGGAKASSGSRSSGSSRSSSSPPPRREKPPRDDG